MKVKFSREVLIGFSVILVLVITLVAVAVRRFRHHDVPVEVAAMHEELRAHEMEAHKPTFEAPAADPLRGAPAEAERPRDVFAGWNSPIKERGEEKAEHHADSKPLALDAPPAMIAIKPEHHEGALHETEHHEAHHAEEHPALPPVPPADRYAVPPAARTEVGPGSTMVIQVGDDAPGRRSREPDRPAVRERVESATPFMPPRYDAPVSSPPGLPPGYAIADNRGEFSDPRRPRDPSAYRDDRLPQGSGEPARNDREPREGYQPREGNRQSGGLGYGEVAATGYPAAGGFAREYPPRRDERREMDRAPLRNDGKYEVQPNDSYWTISERVYGSGAYFRALAEHNRGKAARPDRLSPGLVIDTPPLAQLEKDYPDFCPRVSRRDAVRNRAAASLTGYAGGGATYVVQEGDTLTSIARNELGKVSRWAEIYQLNREQLGKEYDYLTPGMKLVLPSREGPATDRTTRRSDAPPFTR